MYFGHIIDLVGPLSVEKTLDNDETVVVDIEVFGLYVLDGALVGKNAVVERPVAFEVGFGGEYLGLDVHHSSIIKK